MVILKQNVTESQKYIKNIYLLHSKKWIQKIPPYYIQTEYTGSIQNHSPKSRWLK